MIGTKPNRSLYQHRKIGIQILSERQLIFNERKLLDNTLLPRSLPWRHLRFPAAWRAYLSSCR
jgi:hypothetical protein